MESTTPIRRSTNGMNIQILLSAVVAILIGLLASWFLGRILGWTSGGGVTAERWAWIAIGLLWIVSSMRLWFDWRAKRYEIAPDSLIVHAKAGSFGNSQTIYRYESIISVRMTQGFWGERFGYGDIRITLSKIDHEIVMNDIEDPLHQISEIKRRMNDQQNAATAAYVS